MAQHSKWGSIIAVVTILLICAATLTPGTQPSPDDAASFCAGSCDDALLADFLRNVVLFIPLGFGLRLGGMRASRAIVIGSCLSAAVEILQIRVIVGRDASWLDWLSNSAGTALGTMIAAELSILIRPDPRAARRLTISALIFCLLALALGAWGLQPAPTAAAYFGERTPMLGNAVFAGELLSAGLNGVELPSDRMKDANSVRTQLREGRVWMDAVVRAAPMPAAEDVVPIGRVADADQREILLLGRDRRDLVFKFRMHATAAHLETPTFALAQVFPRANDDPRRTVATPPESLTAVLGSGRIRLSATTEAGRRELDFALTPALAWTFFLPWDYWLGPEAVVFSWAWLALLVFPIGYWGAQSGGDRNSRLLLAGLGVAIVTTLALMPPLFGLAVPHIDTFVAVVVGAGVGGIAGAAVSRSARVRR